MTEPGLQIPGVLDGYLERIPMGRVGTPDDIASAAAFLASDEASYLSGANIFVDGAWAVTGHPDFRPQ
jgi:NAD(P)-dependent dehydrogenase (short-subunit alcohol dehydrogenase family)